MGKRLNLLIEKCGDCPFCRYDCNYGMSYDSGWDCHHPEAEGFRIPQEGVSEKESAEATKTLPDWCPLPNAKEVSPPLIQ